MRNTCREDDLLPDSTEFQGYLRSLKEIDFELAYLAILTREGIKPLSRWEKPLADKDLELLQRIGLLRKQVRRTVKSGKEFIETIFSRSEAYLRLYEQAFVNTPIDKSAPTQRLEGFCFGYPPCCVNQYIRKPYAPNNMPEKEQKILFHWACQDCKVTPLLLPAYKSVHDLIDRC